MRIRSTKPDFWRSERIAAVDWEPRFVLKGLESFVDDNGVGRDDLALIVGDLFSRDLVREPSRTLARVSESISVLHSAGLIWRYAHEGTRLLYVSFWETIQRVDKPQPGRFPRPDGTWNYKDSIIRESVASPREPSRNVAPGTEEQGNRGTGEQTPQTPQRENEPSRADQVSNGGVAVNGHRSNLPAHTLDARHIAQAFSDSLTVPIQSGLLDEVGVQIEKCLRDDIPPTAIANGVLAWAESNSWSPTQIPKFVLKANSGARNGRGKPTAKAAGYDDALAQLLQEVETL